MPITLAKISLATTIFYILLTNSPHSQQHLAQTLEVPQLLEPLAVESRAKAIDSYSNDKKAISVQIRSYRSNSNDADEREGKQHHANSQTSSSQRRLFPSGRPADSERDLLRLSSGSLMLQAPLIDTSFSLNQFSSDFKSTEEGGGGKIIRRETRSSDCEHDSSPKQPAVFGIRRDKDSGEIVDGLLVIKANVPTEIMLVGYHLNANLSVALTTEKKDAQADCTHADRIRLFNFKNVSSNVARVVVNVPSSPIKEPYYLCLRDSASEDWFHQGTSPWLSLHVKEDFLPFFMKIIILIFLLMLSGLFSGLNLGLMALDKNELQVIISCGSDTEKRYARAIAPVQRRGNYLLCSILFSNVLVNSTIAVLLEELTSGIVAVITSTVFIVMFGEILPQSFCSRYGLAVGAKTVSITYFCMVVTFPLSYPVSCFLDWALGEEIAHAYDRERLMEFIRVTRDYNNLETDEVNIISGALKLKRIPLSDIMTRIEDVYMLDLSSCLDFQTIQAIMERGYSRIPVHEPGNKKNIVALLFAKDLALLDPDDCTPVQTLINFYNHPIMYLFEDTTLDLALNEFKTGKSHMAFVRRVLDDGDRDPVYEITGIVTLEDVIEEIMQMEINDETDTLSDNRRKRRRKEAQIGGDFSQFANFGAGETSFNIVTPQLCLAAYQYLATTVEPFSAKYISDAILRRLLSQKIYFRVKTDDGNKEKRLYTAGEPADYFVMILEGRVHVVCGRENLVFDGGPFSFFGKAALSAAGTVGTKLDWNTSYNNQSSCSSQTGSLKKGSTSERQPLAAKRRSSQQAYHQILNNQLSISMKKLEQTLATNESETTITNFTSSASVPAGSGTKQQSGRTSVISIEKLAAHFVPDYTVEVATNTSYLKITRNDYLAAIRATLVERGMAIEDDQLEHSDNVSQDQPLLGGGSAERGKNNT